MSGQGWIAVDLDGTLAVYPHSFPEVGPPIAPMVERVRGWIAEGKEVRIFTARVGLRNLVGDEGLEERTFVVEQRQKIENFCIAQFGVPLLVTAQKDFQMIELWDDRCVQVITNTGEALQDRLLQLEAMIDGVA